jgi:hypothetical protein
VRRWITFTAGTAVAACGVALTLSGCALVSGLSDLEVGDGGEPSLDATLDVQLPVLDAGPDVGADVVDAGTDANADAAPPITIMCDNLTCVLPDVCCRRGFADAGGFTRTCEPAQKCPPMGTNNSVPSSCDGPRVCKKGETCCATVQGAIVSQIACSSSICDSVTEIRLCDLDGGPPSNCSNGRTCKPATAGSFPNYLFCQ